MGVLSPSCSSLGEFCTLLLLECPSHWFPVALSESQSDSWLSHSKTNHLFSPCGDFFITSSHVSIPSRGGLGSMTNCHTQVHPTPPRLMNMISSYPSLFCPPTGQPWIGLGDCTPLGASSGWGMGRCYLSHLWT